MKQLFKNKKNVLVILASFFLMFLFLSLILLWGFNKRDNSESRAISYLEDDVESIEQYPNRSNQFPLKYYTYNSRHYLLDLSDLRIYQIDSNFELEKEWDLSDNSSEQSQSSLNSKDYISSSVKVSDKDLLILVINEDKPGSEIRRVRFEESKKPSVVNRYPLDQRFRNLLFIDNKFKDKIEFEENITTEMLANINLNDFVGIDGVFIKVSKLHELNNKLNQLIREEPKYVNEIPELFAIKGGAIPSGYSDHTFINSNGLKNQNSFTIYSEEGNEFILDYNALSEGSFDYTSTLYVSNKNVLNLLGAGPFNKVSIHNTETKQNKVFKEKEDYLTVGVFELDGKYYTVYVDGVSVFVVEVQDF